MINRRLEELLRDPRVHGEQPKAEEVRALQEAVLTRLAAERLMQAVPVRPMPVLVWVERSALIAALVVTIITLADWLGSLWSEADLAVRSKLPDAPTGGWLKAAADAFVEQPAMGAAILAGLALLLLPPVRQTLIRELR
jgi:hypothetical protein